MVEAIARLLHGGGIEVGSKDLHQGFAATLQLLTSRHEVTLFDATVLHENMCARIDILRKQGPKLQLIEVKAKSIDSGSDTQPFRNKNGSISSAWEPYLADVAYQTWLLQANFPAAAVTPFLCLVDKAATVNGDAIFAQFRLEPADEGGDGYRRTSSITTNPGRSKRMASPWLISWCGKARPGCNPTSWWRSSGVVTG
jgi:hypothetical protein